MNLEFSKIEIIDQTNLLFLVQIQHMSDFQTCCTFLTFVCMLRELTDMLLNSVLDLVIV